MMPKKVYDKIGGWDEDYFFYGEDIDISYRLQQAGYQIIYYPKTTTTHLRGLSSGFRKETNKISRATKETRLRVAQASVDAWKIFVLKHYTRKYPKIFIWFMILGINLKGKLRLLKNKLFK